MHVDKLQFKRFYRRNTHAIPQAQPSWMVRQARDDPNIKRVLVQVQSIDCVVQSCSSKQETLAAKSVLFVSVYHEL